MSDITNLATNAPPHAKLNEFKCEISIITKLPSNASLSAKIKLKVKQIEGKGEIPNTTNLVTSTALTSLKSIISYVSNFVKKTDCSRKISEIENKIVTDQDHDKYITTQEFNKSISENLAARLKQANLASKSDFANFVKKTDFDNKPKDVTSNKNELKKLSRKIKASSTKGLIKDSINKFATLNGPKYFSSGIYQNYLVVTQKIH